jgi:RimJ/RimL family protein N-acetyltransferase
LDVIRATEADRAEIEAFLRPHAEFAMFPLNNLARYGMAGGHPNAVSVWFQRRADQITDVLTLTDGGMILPFLPSRDYAAAAQALRGRQVTGFAGRRDDVRGVEAACTLTTPPRPLDHDEPHFLLHLSDLIVPTGPGQIVPLARAPAAVVQGWMLDYQLRTLLTPPDQAQGRMLGAYANYTAMGSHVVLVEGDTPLAMTGFNAQIPDMVQVGGVYTPPDLRSQGHARRAVALHLAQTGAARAVLFSASVAAARAYHAIGFRQIGDWTLTLFRDPVMVA